MPTVTVSEVLRICTSNSIAHTITGQLLKTSKVMGQLSPDQWESLGFQCYVSGIFLECKKLLPPKLLV